VIEPNLQVGELVLELDHNPPRGMWRPAVVTKVHPSVDGLVQKCSIKTSTGTYLRPITNLCPLDVKKED